jgi:hypothetical protein
MQLAQAIFLFFKMANDAVGNPHCFGHFPRSIPESCASEKALVGLNFSELI